VAADQYLAIVLTGNVYKREFEHRGIGPYTLTRQIEDTATVTIPLIPWSSCGAYAAGVLGESTVAFAPFAFFNIVNPILSFTYAALGVAIHRTEPDAHFPDAPHETAFYNVAGQHGDEQPSIGVD
jgi:NhaC family Na+:H+ antiporter